MNALIRWAALTALFTLTGCAVMPLDRFADSAAERVAARTGVQPVWQDAGTAALPAAPFTLPTALAHAFAHNPGLRREYARLGLAHADLEDAARIANPRLSFGWFDPSGDGSDRTTRGIALSFSDLLLLPARRRLSAADFRRVEFEVAGHLIDLAGTVEKAWYTYVGALQIASLRNAIAEAAATESELASRYHAAGNIPRLDLDLQVATSARAAIDALRARSDAAAARSELADLLGLKSDSGWRTVERLPEPPETPLERDQLSRLALVDRFDLAALRQEIAMREDAARIARRWRWLGPVEAGYERERESDGSKDSGPTLAFELPLFDQGQGAVERAEAKLADAYARHAATALAVQNEVSAALERVKNAAEIAMLHRRSVLPAAASIVERRQEQVNFMLRGSFELLESKREQYGAWQAWLESLRDYWIARSALSVAVGGRLPGDEAERPLTAGADEILGERS